MSCRCITTYLQLIAVTAVSFGGYMLVMNIFEEDGLDALTSIQVKTFQCWCRRKTFRSHPPRARTSAFRNVDLLVKRFRLKH
jgi:hypothetical protein